MRVLPLILLTACTHITLEEHQARKDALGAGDDSGGDTGAPLDLSGDWTGTFVIDIVVNETDHDLIDDCTGEMDATLTPSGESYSVSGTGRCTSGSLVAVDAELEGTVDRLLDAAGQISLEVRDESRGSPRWNGAVSGEPPTTLQGAFSFEIGTILEYECTGEGTFTLEPVQAR